MVMDALHANTPMVNLLRDLNLRLVLVVKETSQSTVYENFLAGVRERISDPVRKDAKGIGAWNMPAICA